MLCKATTHTERRHLLSFSSPTAAADVGTQAAPWGRGRWRAEWTAIKSLGLLVRLRFRTALIPLCPWALFSPPVLANGRVGGVEELPAAPALHWAAWEVEMRLNLWLLRPLWHVSRCALIIYPHSSAGCFKNERDERSTWSSGFVEDL